jgi:hypothetical protein
MTVRVMIISGVSVGNGVGVFVRTGVGVADGRGVRVGIAVGTNVGSDVSVGGTTVFVAVARGVAVGGTGIGVPHCSIIPNRSATSRARTTMTTT